MKNRLFKREGQTEQSCHRAGLLGNWPAPLWSFSSLFFFEQSGQQEAQWEPWKPRQPAWTMMPSIFPSTLTGSAERETLEPDLYYYWPAGGRSPEGVASPNPDGWSRSSRVFQAPRLRKGHVVKEFSNWLVRWKLVQQNSPTPVITNITQLLRKFNF